MEYVRKPSWLKSSKLGARKTGEILRSLRKYNLHTVCESAKCPNRGECFDRGTATFMILGDICTRNCRFCALKTGKPLDPDQEEPEKIAKLAHELSLQHIVVTTVTRDDLPDGGAEHFCKVLTAIKNRCAKNVSVEFLISDLGGDIEQIDKIIKSKPDVLNHNVETISRLYAAIRPEADYSRSLQLLTRVKIVDPNMLTKSGFMLGLGETESEILDLMRDLRDAKVDLLTIGQYMAPSRYHYPVKSYVHPDKFDFYKQKAREMGFLLVESGPLVRSSYRAERVRKILRKG